MTVDGGGLLCEARAHAERAAYPIVLKRFLAPSDSRLWRILALLRRGMPAERIRGVTGISSWFLWEFERAIALEREVRARWARASPSPADDEAATLLATAKRDGFGDRELGADGRRHGRGRCGWRGWSSGLVPGYAMVDTCAAEFAAETPYFYATYAAAGSEPELPPVAPAGGARHRLRAGPDRAGDRVRLLRGPGRGRAARPGLAGGHDQLQPGDGLDRLRRVVTPVLRAARSGVAFGRSSRRSRRDGAATAAGAFVQFGGQTPLNLAEPLAAAGIPLLGANLETIDQAEDRIRFANLVESLGIPQPEGGMARSIEEALALADQIGYPVIVRPSFVIGGLAIDFSYSPSDLVNQLARATDVDVRPAGPDRPLSRRRRSRHRRRRRRRHGPDPRAARAHRACRRPFGRLGRHVPAAEHLGLGPGADSRRDGPHRACARTFAAWSTPSSSSATTASTSSR